MAAQDNSVYINKLIQSDLDDYYMEKKDQIAKVDKNARSDKVLEDYMEYVFNVFLEGTAFNTIYTKFRSKYDFINVRCSDKIVRCSVTSLSYLRTFKCYIASILPPYCGITNLRFSSFLDLDAKEVAPVEWSPNIHSKIIEFISGFYTTDNIEINDKAVFGKLAVIVKNTKDIKSMLPTLILLGVPKNFAYAIYRIN
jgi:hypothetical protein